MYVPHSPLDRSPAAPRKCSNGCTARPAARRKPSDAPDAPRDVADAVEEVDCHRAGGRRAEATGRTGARAAGSSNRGVAPMRAARSRVALGPPHSRPRGTCPSGGRCCHPPRLQPLETIGGAAVSGYDQPPASPSRACPAERGKRAAELRLHRQRVPVRATPPRRLRQRYSVSPMPSGSLAGDLHDRPRLRPLTAGVHGMNGHRTRTPSSCSSCTNALIAVMPPGRLRIMSRVPVVDPQLGVGRPDERRVDAAIARTEPIQPLLHRVLSGDGS